MATLAPAIPLPETHDPPTTLARKATALAARIRAAKHFIVFTGAGISTSAGIADFRGPAGAWTLRAQGRAHALVSGDAQQAVPTPTHMALVGLQEAGLLAYLVSQNCDGLHRRSGILPDRISELHGNSNLEYCKEGCGKEYLRDFRAVAPDDKPATYHLTGRKCALCTRPLHDTIINFGEFLPEQPLALAEAHAQKADLCLVLGSSLTVPPACTIPETVGRRGTARSHSRSSSKAALVICNLQDTPLDELATARVYARTDELMVRVMAELGVPIPRFVLRRRLVVRSGWAGPRGKWRVGVAGVDVDGTPASFLRSVRCGNNRRLVRGEPFDVGFRGRLEPGEGVRLELQFMGHYGEPNLEVVYEYGGGESEEVVYGLEYDPSSGKWEARREAVDGAPV